MRIIFALAGREYSGLWLQHWTEIINYCHNRGIEFIVSQKYSCNIYYARNLTLCGDVLKGENQKPFQGQIAYDYIVFIDSDVLVKPEQLQKLLNYKEDIISGIYLMEDGKQYATVIDWNEEIFKKQGHFDFLAQKDIKDEKRLIEVDYTGFGFIIFKYGVLESLTYPWFKPIFYKIGDCVDFSMEDVSILKRLAEKGYKTYIDPKVKVGHEKKTVLI